MKCPNCGAENNGNFCEYCGSEVSKRNPSGGACPKCGNTNISFKRERVGTATKRTSRKNVLGTGRTGESVSQSAYRTVGVCQNCGHTWNPNGVERSSGKKTWLWVLGWICIFPIPLMLLLMRKKDLKPVVKYGIIAVAWVLYFIIGLGGNTDANSTMTDIPKSTEVVQTTQPTDQSAENKEDVDTSLKLAEYIDNVVSQYNEQALEPLVFVEEFTPSDDDSSHYRVEFRLSAYDNAVGKSFMLGDKVVDLVATETYFGDINFRVYTNDTSLEQVIALVQGMSPIMDEDLSAKDLQDTINEITSKKAANGYYYGDLGITLFGSDVNGYELMIKRD